VVDVDVTIIYWNKAIMTGTGGLLPWFKVRDGWFKTHPE